MRSEKIAINRLTDVNSKVSCHYFIKRNGSIILMVPEIYAHGMLENHIGRKINYLIENQSE